MRESTRRIYKKSIQQDIIKLLDKLQEEIDEYTAIKFKDQYYTNKIQNDIRRLEILLNHSPLLREYYSERYKLLNDHIQNIKYFY